MLGFVEIHSARVGVETAHDVVMRFRPNFLQPRRATDGTRELPVVYLDYVRQGGPDMLRSIPADMILEIRYFTATEATARFGPYNPGGVISVHTRR